MVFGSQAKNRESFREVLFENRARDCAVVVFVMGEDCVFGSVSTCAAGSPATT